MKSIFSLTAGALLAVGLAAAMPAAAGSPALTAGKSIIGIAAKAKSGELVQMRFSDGTCRDWRREAREGDRHARRLYRRHCRDGGRADRRSDRFGQCREWRMEARNGDRYARRAYRRFCRSEERVRPRCSDVGGYEAYMRRTGRVCML